MYNLLISICLLIFKHMKCMCALHSLTYSDHFIKKKCRIYYTYSRSYCKMWNRYMNVSNSYFTILNEYCSETYEYPTYILLIFADMKRALVVILSHDTLYLLPLFCTCPLLPVFSCRSSELQSRVGHRGGEVWYVLNPSLD